MSDSLYFTRDANIRVIDLGRLVDPRLLDMVRNPRSNTRRNLHDDKRNQPCVSAA